ncbi:hypothetical protein [Vibrio amylolyticus]|uniref:hypothetical protein n=1 Tax=Vibrio amylolyticus TaxID=2847292 RepID=UPI00354E941E
MATRKQAVALKKLGFKTWARRINPTAPKGKLRKASIRWIQNNLSEAQAGRLVRELRTEPPKQTWQTVLPKRQFAEIRFDSVTEETKLALKPKSRA